MSRRSTRRSAGPATPDKQPQPAIGKREFEEIRRGGVDHGAGDASPKDRAARQKAEQRMRTQQMLLVDADANDKSYNGTGSPQAKKGASRAQESESDLTDEEEDLAAPPSPTTSVKTLVLPPDAAEPEPLIDSKPASFATAPEPPSALVSAAPSLIMQPGGLSGLPPSPTATAHALSLWEKVFFALCVVPVLLAALVQLATTSKTSYFEFSAASRESALMLAATLHATIDGWIVPVARFCFELFEECMVPLAHTLVDGLAWMVAHAVQLGLVALAYYGVRLRRARRIAA